MLVGSDLDPKAPSISPELDKASRSLTEPPSPNLPHPPLVNSCLFSDLVVAYQKPVPSEPMGFHPPRPSFWPLGPSSPIF